MTRASRAESESRYRNATQGSARADRRSRSLRRFTASAPDACLQRQAGVRHLRRGRRRPPAWRTCAFCECARQHVGAGWTVAALASAQIQACAAWARHECFCSRARLGRAIATAARRWRRSDAIDAEVHDRGRVAGCAAQQVRACTQNPAGLSPQTARRRANRASSAG